MRTSFVNALHKMAKKDDRLYSVIADIGIFMFDEFEKEFPGRFINVGIAEQNQIGVCAGLALNGKIPYAYSIAPFVTLRCLEQIRIDLCYQKLNVKIIGGGGGLAYGILGPTHHLIEDYAIMRSLPNMAVLAPSDPDTTEKAVIAARDWEGPVYIRISKDKEKKIYTAAEPYKIGKALIPREGKDAAIISTGTMLVQALDAAELLAKKGIQARVIDMHTIKPLDDEAVLKAAEETRAIVTVEEHNVIGGLGGAVAELLIESRIRKIPMKRIGIDDFFCTCDGSHEFLKDRCGLHPEKIAETVEALLSQK